MEDSERPGPLPARSAMAERFWVKVDVDPDPDACWMWTAAVSRDGTGKFTHSSGKFISAARAAWEIEHGEPPPSDLQVAHDCGVRGCVRPNHLSLVTHSEQRERASRRQKHIMRKLTVDQVRDIRRRSSDGEQGKQLAEEYGVSAETVSSIVKRKTYRWVTDDGPTEATRRSREHTARQWILSALEADSRVRMAYREADDRIVVMFSNGERFDLTTREHVGPVWAAEGA